MKKVIVTLVLAVSFLQISFGQSDDSWQKQMEEFQRRMQEMTEQFSKQFEGKGFYFDTTFVMPFNGMADSAFVKRFEFHNFDSNGFPLDTAMMQGFQWFGFDDAPMQLDTFFFKEFKQFGSDDEFPGFQFNEEMTKGLSEMMEQLMKQFEGFGEQFDENGQHFYFKEWKSTPDDKEKNEEKLQPKNTPQKKRKTTTM